MKKLLICGTLAIAALFAALVARGEQMGSSQFSAAPIGSAGGDLTGTYPNPTIASIMGTAVSGVTGTGNAVLATSPTLTTPTVSGTATFNGQMVTGAGTPTITSGNCGTGTNGAVVAGSTNQSGQITIGASATTTCTISWSATLGSAPKACVFFPMNATAAATGTTVARVGAPSTTSVVLTGSALASANYAYLCL